MKSRLGNQPTFVPSPLSTKYDREGYCRLEIQAGGLTEEDQSTCETLDQGTGSSQALSKLTVIVSLAIPFFLDIV